MGDILEALKTLQNTSVPNLLVGAGLVLLLLGFVGKLGAIIELPSNKQKWAGIIGTLLLISGVSLFLVPNIESTPNKPPQPSEPAQPAEPAQPSQPAHPVGNPPVPEPPNPAAREALLINEQLNMGQELLSDNKLYSFKFQNDCNLIVYDNKSDRVLWASNTNGSDADHLYMQEDGNLVLYTKDGNAIWETKTNYETDDYFLIMQNDGNLVLYRGKLHSENATPLWDTATVQQ